MKTSNFSFSDLTDDQLNVATEPDPIPDPAPDPDPIDGPEPDPDPDPDPDPEQPEDENTPEEESIFQSLGKNLGYEIEGEFEDSVEGLTEYTRQVAQKMSDSILNDVFSKLPDVQEYMVFRMQGGDPKEYFSAANPEINFSTLTLTEDDDSAIKLVARAALKKQGHDEEDIVELIKTMDASGALFQFSQKNLKILAKDQAQTKQKLIDDAADKARKEKEDQDALISAIESTIKTRKLGNITLPVQEEKAFMDWMMKPVDKQGRTQRLIDVEKRDIETKLALEYIAFKGLDLKRLVELTKATELKKKISEHIKTKKPTAMAGTTESGTKGVIIPTTPII